MAVASKWKLDTAKVTDLDLDLQNPRLPHSVKPRTPREVYAELVENCNVIGVAESIAANGFFFSDPLIVVKERGKQIVVEGNRRLAALKLLIDSGPAPEKAKRRFNELREKMSAVIESVPIVYAPSRTDAIPLIAARHTNRGILPWNPLAQAQYYKHLLHSGMSVEEVAMAAGATPSDIEQKLRRSTLRDLAAAMDDLPTDVRETIQDPNKFHITNLERLLDSTLVKEWLGVTYTEAGDIEGRVAASEFKRGFRQLVIAVAKNVVNSRSFPKPQQLAKFLRKQREQPDLTKKGSFNSETIIAGTTVGASSASSTSKKKRVKAKARRALVTSDFRPNVTNAKIENIVDEMRSLRADSHTVCAAVMLRVLFELCAKHYLERTGKLKAVLINYNKTKAMAEKYPSLRYMFDALMKDVDVTSHLGGDGQTSLNRVRTNPSHYLTVESLHGFVHNQFDLPSEKQLHSMWDCLSPLLTILLDESAAKSSRAAGKGASP